MGWDGKGREAKQSGREAKRKGSKAEGKQSEREGKGREGKGREGKGREGKGSIVTPQAELRKLRQQLEEKTEQLSETRDELEKVQTVSSRYCPLSSITGGIVLDNIPPQMVLFCATTTLSPEWWWLSRSNLWRFSSS